jgi:chitin synthase
MNTKDNRLPNQIRSLLTILDAFGACKTASNSSASQHGRYLELNFSSSGEGRRSRSDGRLIGGKVLTFGLNKTRMTKLERDERTFHVFYQLLAGAQPDEREELQLEGPDGYELLASSGCYRLPGGPFSDDSLQFDELRIAMANLGFKAKHLKSIFNILVTLLLLGNIEFEDGPMTGVVMDESATISHESRIILEQVAWRLGVPAEELEQGLTNETRYIRKELCSSFLDAAGAGRQRDTLVKDLYAILFAFVVETANRKIAPPDFEDEQEGIEGITTIVQMDLPGYQSKTSMGSGEGKAQSHQPLVNTTGVNSVDEFAINFSNELLHSYLTRRTFEDQVQGGLNSATVSDGIALPRVMTMDNSACVEMLRGGIIQPRTTRLASKPTGLLGVMDDAGVAIDPERGYNEITRQDEQLLADLTRACGVHASFVANPVTIGNAALGLRGSLTPQDGKRHSFGINHYAGPCTYDVSHFVEKNADIVDAQLVSMLRASNDSFIAKLVSGPSISAEGHPLDENTVVQAQVSVTPLREPTSSNGLSLENTKAYPLTTQLNATMTDLLGSLDGMSLWNVACIKPNDSGHPNSIDKRRVKNQIRSMLLPDMLVRKQVDYVASEDLLDFCYQHGLRYDVDDRNSIQSAVQRFAAEHGWTAGSDYAIGHQRLWLAYEAWRDVDLAMRAIEGEEAAEDVESEPFGSPQRTPYGAANSVEDGIGSLAGTPRGRGGYDESRENLLLDKGEATRWNSGYKSGIDSPGVVPHLDQGYPFEKTDEEKGFTGREAAAADMIVHEKGHHAEVETLPTTKARRWWVRLTWTLTWWIPSFLLAKVGRMKRPDVRMAWREKFAICLMIFLLCGIIIFYIIVFGQLLCPNMNKAWNTSQLTEHGDASSYYAAIHGYVYDVRIGCGILQRAIALMQLLF